MIVKDGKEYYDLQEVDSMLEKAILEDAEILRTQLQEIKKDSLCSK